MQAAALQTTLPERNVTDRISSESCHRGVQGNGNEAACQLLQERVEDDSSWPISGIAPPSCSQFCGLFKRLVSFHARNNAERPPKRQGFLKEPNLLIYREMRHPEIGALIPNAKVALPYLAVLRHQF